MNDPIDRGDASVSDHDHTPRSHDKHILATVPSAKPLVAQWHRMTTGLEDHDAVQAALTTWRAEIATLATATTLDDVITALRAHPNMITTALQRAAGAGDTIAARVLLHAYLPWIVRCMPPAAQQLSDPRHSDDFDDTITRVWLALTDQPTTTKLTRQIRELARQQQRDHEIEPGTVVTDMVNNTPPSAQTCPTRDPAAQLLDDCISGGVITADDLDLLIRVVGQRGSYQRIAAETGRTTTALRQQACRARKAIRDHLGQAKTRFPARPTFRSTTSGPRLTGVVS